MGFVSRRKPLARMCFSHSPQQPQAGLLYTVTSGLYCACAAGSAASARPAPAPKTNTRRLIMLAADLLALLRRQHRIDALARLEPGFEHLLVGRRHLVECLACGGIVGFAEVVHTVRLRVHPAHELALFAPHLFLDGVDLLALLIGEVERRVSRPVAAAHHSRPHALARAIAATTHHSRSHALSHAVAGAIATAHHSRPHSISRSIALTQGSAGEQNCPGNRGADQCAFHL